MNVYKQLLQYEKPKVFKVEPKYGKAYMEPDIFTIWQQSPFFIEVQNSVYSKKVMQEKLNRYEVYFHSLEWQRRIMATEEIQIFPHYSSLRIHNMTSTPNFRIFQTKSIHDFMNQMVVKA